MKLIARIIIITSLSYLLSFYLPWWIVVVVSFLTGFLLYGGGFNVFLSGFLSGGILWMAYAWILDYQTDSFLSNKIASLFELNDPVYLIIASGVIGGFGAGLGASTGSSLRNIFIKKKSKSYYN